MRSLWGTHARPGFTTYSPCERLPHLHHAHQRLGDPGPVTGVLLGGRRPRIQFRLESFLDPVQGMQRPLHSSTDSLFSGRLFHRAGTLVENEHTRTRQCGPISVPLRVGARFPTGQSTYLLVQRFERCDFEIHGLQVDSAPLPLTNELSGFGGLLPLLLSTFLQGLRRLLRILALVGHCHSIFDEQPLDRTTPYVISGKKPVARNILCAIRTQCRNSAGVRVPGVDFTVRRFLSHPRSRPWRNGPSPVLEPVRERGCARSDPGDLDAPRRTRMVPPVRCRADR